MPQRCRTAVGRCPCECTTPPSRQPPMDALPRLACNPMFVSPLMQCVPHVLADGLMGSCQKHADVSSMSLSRAYLPVCLALSPRRSGSGRLDLHCPGCFSASPLILPAIATRKHRSLCLPKLISTYTDAPAHVHGFSRRFFAPTFLFASPTARCRLFAATSTPPACCGAARIGASWTPLHTFICCLATCHCRWVFTPPPHLTHTHLYFFTVWFRLLPPSSSPAAATLFFSSWDWPLYTPSTAHTRTPPSHPPCAHGTLGRGSLAVLAAVPRAGGAAAAA